MSVEISAYIIRCGTPDCDWGFPLPDIAAWRIERCYAEFGKHCTKTHGLLETDDAQMYLDLKVGTLTLWKNE